MERMNGDELIALGTVLRPVGLDGRCRVETHGDSLKGMALPSPVFLGNEGKQPAPAVLREVFASPKGCTCLFEGCSSMDDAERLRGATIFAQHSRLPQLKAGHYYHFQLIGLKVVLSPSGREWGTVGGVHNFPAADALEVSTAEGGSVMVPLTRDVMQAINLEAGTVTVDAGALEEFL